MAAYAQLLNGESDFHLRRAVERLREGLFDPVAVRLLTAHEERLKQALERGFEALDRGKAPHLCICGAYGQGKSHSLTYAQEQALRGNFVTSMINLDPREVPFYDFRRVYRALMAQLRFPDTAAGLTGRWRDWAAGRQAEGRSDGIEDLLPEEMPHVFRAVLAGLAQKTLALSHKQRQLKKHATYRPRQFPYLLSRALAGEVVPLVRLRHALKYRQVAFYKAASLACRGNEPYVQMMRGLARLFRQMGYRGWVLLFDEGESIAQGPIDGRSRSYQLLDQLFSPPAAAAGLYPVVAFTDDFFHRVGAEEYDRVRVRDEVEIPYFAKDYARAWKGLTRYSLQDLAPEEWDELAQRLLHLHARAYRWKPPQARLTGEMGQRLQALAGQETRYRLKALVDQIDLVHQEGLLSP